MCQSIFALQPSNELRKIIDAENYKEREDRIIHHWLGMPPNDYQWELNEAIGRVVFAVLPDYISQSDFILHGIIGDDGGMPSYEILKFDNRYIEIPKTAAFFLENKRDQKRMIIGCEVGVFNKWIIHMCGENVSYWMEKLREFVAANNFLRGHCFDIKGKSVPHETVKLSDVILTDVQKKAVGNHIVRFVSNLNRIEELNGKKKRGVLLEGEPGCGKSMLLKALANEFTDVSICYISPGSISETEDIENLLTFIKMTNPCIVMIEEIDLLGCDRSIIHSVLLGELMQAMDGIRTAQGVLWIATTNRIEVVESALANRPGRIDRHIKFTSLPDEQRIQLLQLSANPFELSDDALTFLCKHTHGFTGAQLNELMETVRLFWLGRNQESKLINQEIVVQAVQDCGYSNMNRFGFSSC